jgi:hypothetical protein
MDAHTTLPKEKLVKIVQAIEKMEKEIAKSNRISPNVWVKFQSRRSA